MKLNFTKTIFIIVFVVFLGIIKSSNVEAYYAQCYYESDEGYAILSINDTFSQASINKFYKYSGSTLSNITIGNWTASQSASRVSNIGYNGYEDSWNNDRCPEFLVININIAYVSDSTNLDKAKNYIKNTYSVLQLKAHSYPNSSVSGNISYKVCECEAGSDKVAYNIAQNRNLISTSGNANIKNWISVIDTSIKHIGLQSAIFEKPCPDIVKSGSSYYIVGASNKDAIINKVGAATEFSCNPSSSTPAEPIIPKPEYANPSINTGIVTPFDRASDTYNCGNSYIIDIPSTIPRVTSLIYTIFQIIVPVSLVILGMIDLMRAVTSQKEDEIKKGQQTFMKRVIVAIIIFFVFAFVKLAVSIFSTDSNDIVSCMSCFLEGINHCE